MKAEPETIMVLLTKELAREVVVSFGSALSEGQLGDVEPILLQIYDKWPEVFEGEGLLLDMIGKTC